MKVLVVTGGIGSGKSEVCHLLAEKGYVLQYNADRRAKELYSEYPELLAEIEASLDLDCHDPNGDFLPSVLAQRIFSDREALSKVEELLFPVMMADFTRFASQADEEQYVVFESATILEKSWFDGFGDKVLLVDAPVDVRLQRAAERDNVSKDIILARMQNQPLMNALSEGADDPRIDYVLKNDGSHEDMNKNLISILEKF